MDQEVAVPLPEAPTRIGAPSDAPVLAPVTARPSRLVRLLRRVAHAFVARMPWRWQERIYFVETFGRIPNLRAPRGFNEKVLYRKAIHGDHATYRRLSDKFAVRAHIAERIGEAFLIPLLHDTTDPATLLSLPAWQRTVIKPNHGSGMVTLVREEPDAARKLAIVAECTQWLMLDFSHAAREIQYRGIPPRILVEQDIGEGGEAPADYKFHMFRQHDGSFQYVLQVIQGRDDAWLRMAFYVNNLVQPFHQIRQLDDAAPPCTPELLRQALHLSETLAAEFDYVRVDWYIQRERIYFGELTFTPGAGFVTGLDQLDQRMGEMWIQPGLEAANPALPVTPVAPA